MARIARLLIYDGPADKLLTQLGNSMNVGECRRGLPGVTILCVNVDETLVDELSTAARIAIGRSYREATRSLAFVAAAGSEPVL
jgi:hypothetical protein